MDLSHTLTVKPNLYIRALIKFYGLRYPYGLNTCKLFWGGVGMVILPFLIVALSPILGFVALCAYVSDKAKAREAARMYEEDGVVVSPTKSRRAKWLEGFAAKAGMVWFKVQTPVTWFFRVLVGGAILIALTVLVVWLASVVPGLPWLTDILPTAGIALGVFAVPVAVGGLLIVAYEKWRAKHPKKPKGERIGVLKAVFNSIHDHTCANVEVVEKV